MQKKSTFVAALVGLAVLAPTAAAAVAGPPPGLLGPPVPAPHSTSPTLTSIPTLTAKPPVKRPPVVNAPVKKPVPPVKPAPTTATAPIVVAKPAISTLQPKLPAY